MYVKQKGLSLRINLWLITFQARLSFVFATKYVDTFFNWSCDCFESWFQEFTWVEEFLLVVFCFVCIVFTYELTSSICKCDLAFSVNVNFRNTKFDRCLDLIIRDTWTTVQYDWESWKSFCQFLQVIQGQDLPSLLGMDRGCYQYLLPKKSIPVATIALASSIGANSPLPMIPSSSPPIVPTSASTEIPLAWAFLQLLSPI